MVVGEALARGLPVVSCPTGAITELVAPDAGVLVPPGNVTALAQALADLIEHADVRARLAAGARDVRDRLPTWDTSARLMAAALERAGRS
jgi:glycosyltransferase involved in cell wall biosynthesis